jgi:hypothetical protein
MTMSMSIKPDYIHPRKTLNRFKRNHYNFIGYKYQTLFKVNYPDTIDSLYRDLDQES